MKCAVRGDGPDRARRHAQLALQARVVVDRLVVGGRLGVDQDRPQQDEVAELGVDDVAVDAHVPQARRDGDRLVRDDPDLAGEAVHLHREAHRRVDRPDALLLQGGDDLAGDLVDVIAGVVELQVGDRAGRAADRLPVHPADEAEERLGRREEPQDVGPLVVQGRAADLDQADVVGPASRQSCRSQAASSACGAGDAAVWRARKRRIAGWSFMMGPNWDGKYALNQNKRSAVYHPGEGDPSPTP